MMGNIPKARYTAFIALAAFLLNALLPFFADYNISANAAVTSAASQSDASELSALFGEKILICTADGFKWVSLADLQNGKEKPAPHPELKCAACYVAAHGFEYKLPALAVFDYHADVVITSVDRFELADQPAAKFIAKQHQSRAPPISLAT